MRLAARYAASVERKRVAAMRRPASPSSHAPWLRWQRTKALAARSQHMGSAALMPAAAIRRARMAAWRISLASYSV